jgi:hypothetical protein
VGWETRRMPLAIQCDEVRPGVELYHFSEEEKLDQLFNAAACQTTQAVVAEELNNFIHLGHFLQRVR